MENRRGIWLIALIVVALLIAWHIERMLSWIGAHRPALLAVSGIGVIVVALMLFRRRMGG